MTCGSKFLCKTHKRQFKLKEALEQHQKVLGCSEHQKISDNVLYRCEIHMSKFKSKQALLQHQQALNCGKKSWTATSNFLCKIHNKKFNSEEALRQHQRVLCCLNFLCIIHNKKFKSEQALKQHQDVLGCLKNEEEEEEEYLSPPVLSPGKWVDRKDFPGYKSFGYFSCSCGKTWVSAHAFKIYEQGCKLSETYSLPKKMWLNLTDKPKNKDKKGKGPHDRQRCMACRAGKCTA